jgi:hypothetical protein
MIWKPKSILEYNSKTKEWGKRRFETYQSYLAFVKSNWKLPGKYDFTETENWRQPALYYKKEKRYTPYHQKSKEYKDFWLVERRKCEQGVIVDGVFIPGSYYWFINYTPIYNKLEMCETFPDLFDGQYHLALYLDLCELEDQDAAGTKCRQRGISLFLMALLTKEVWFGKKSTTKIVGMEEEYVLMEWAIMEGYRDWLNSNTGWYRQFTPNESLNWEQKVLVTEGTINKRAFFKGNKTRIKGATTKKNIAKSVGGAARYIYATEAGIYNNLKKVLGYVKDNLKMGGVKTGMFIAMGSVGELRDAADLQDFCFNPTAYNIRPVQDTFSGTLEPVAFFYPDYWNYTYKNEETGEIIKCYDEHGNSNIQLALEYIELEAAKAKKAGEAELKMYKSQHPLTLQDAFDQREDNPFPTELLKRQEQLLIGEKRIIVSLEKDFHGKITHKFSNDVPISKIKPNPNEDNRGAVIVYEFPIDKPPFGLYYAGVDPIYNLDTSTSSSLMSITVWIGTHERDGKIVEPYPVCEYIGRHKNVRDTYQIVSLIIEWYNARTAVESNVKDFTEWMIRQGKSRFLMRRRELTVISEMSQNSTIRDEIGVRMESNFKQRALEKFISWLQTPISTEFDLETGESNDIYNVSKLRDPMLIKEMLRFTAKLNTDRIVSTLLALIAVQSDTNRHIITGVKNPFKELPKQTTTKLPNAFTSQRTSHFKKMPSPFGKR